MTLRCLLRSALVVSVLLPHAAGATLSALDDAARQKAAAKCENAISQAGTKLIATRLKALAACSGSVLTCIQTKPGDVGCTDKAGQKCLKALSSTLPQAESSFQNKVVKSCGAPLRRADLLAADGLDLASRADVCDADFGIDVCKDVASLALCLAREHARGSEQLLATEQPRAYELIGSVSNELPIFLPSYPPPCPTCAQDLAAPTRKAIAQCGATMTKAGQTFAAALYKGFASCLAKAFSCVQTKASDPGCLGKAADVCDKITTKVAAARGKLTSTVDKRCADAALVPFTTLSSAAALNLAALDRDCASFGSGIGDLNAYVGCLQRQHECRLARVVDYVLPRTADLIDAGVLSGLADVLDPTTCPAELPSHADRVPAPRAFLLKTNQFFTMTKIVTATKLPTVAGKAPLSSGNPAGRVTFLGPPLPPRFKPGFHDIVKVSYHFGGRSGARLDTIDTPRLIVAARQVGGDFEDHFELPLDAPPGGTDATLELQIDYAIDPPGCLFDIAFAVEDAGGEVSNYAVVERVEDSVAPATATPTATPRPAPTSTATIAPTPTSVGTGTRTPTPAGGSTATPTSTSAGSPTATSTPNPSALRVFVSSYPNPARAGEQVRFEYTITNTGTGPQSATLTTTIPAHINSPLATADGATCTGGSCDSGEIATWTLALAGGETTTRWVIGNVTGSFTSGTIHTSALLTGAGATDTDDLQIDAASGLQVQIMESADPVQAGTDVTYTLVFSNRGSTAANAVLRLTLPPETSVEEISPGGTESTPHVVEWSLGDVLAGVGGERSVRAGVPANASAVLSATAVASSNGVQQSVSKQTTAVSPARSLLLAKTANANPAARRASSTSRQEYVTYELLVTNRTGAQQTVTLSDVIPKELFLHSVDAGASCGTCGAGEFVSWTLTLKDGETQTRQYTGDPGSSLANGQLITTTARVRAPNLEARAVRPLRVSDAAGLHVTLTESSDPVAPGADETYTVGFANRSAATVAGAVLRLTVPPETTITGISDSGTQTGNVVEWPLLDVLAGTTAERSVRVSVPPNAPPQLVARAEASAAIGEQGIAEQVTAVAAAQPLLVEKMIAPIPARRNEYVLYELMVTNTTDQAKAVVLSDVIPIDLAVKAYDTSGVTCVSTTCDGGEPISWDLGLVPARQTVTRQILGAVVNNAFNGDLLAQTARASTGGFEARAERTLRVSDAPGLQVTLAEDPDPVQRGTDLSYAVTFGNRTSTVSDAVLRLEVPPDTLVKAMDGGTFIPPNVVEWHLGDVAAGAGGERIVRVTVPAGAGEVETAHAEFKAGLGEQATAEQTTAVDDEPPPLVIAKTVTPNPITRDATRNENVTCEISVTNTTAQPIASKVADVIPSELQHLSVDATGLTCLGGTCEGGEPVVWDLQQLQAGETRTRRIAAEATSTVALGEVTSTTARAFGAGVEVRAARALRITNQSPLQIGVVESADPVLPNTDLTYTITYGNRGATPLSNVTLRAILDPTTTTVQPIAGDGSESAPHVVEWTLGTLAAGGVGTRIVSVHVPATGVLAVRVDAVASTAQATAEQRTAVETAPLLEVTESVDVNPVARNNLVTYTFTVKNDDTLPRAIVLSNIVPEELTVQQTNGGVCPGGTCDQGEIVTWDLGLVDGQTSVVKQLVGKTFSNGAAGEIVHDAARANRTGYEARASIDLRVSP